MAKFNILFNNKDYSIDQSSLSDAISALKNHLSTTMSGSGATINFDGVLYNIDSTKLANAQNDFVSHLGTIAGNGHKVTVGGVEYGISSAKVANAVAELGVVFEGLQNDDNDGNGDSSTLPTTYGSAKASKGDGYSLYGGVKLLSLPEYDEETYLYSLIYSLDNNIYFIASDKTIWVTAQEKIFYPEDYSYLPKYILIDNSWEYQEMCDDGSSFNSLIWSNHDILNDSNDSIFLAASDPISLDGMNVIEWDGDTTGLEKFDNTSFYYVSEMNNIDTSKNVVACMRSNLITNDLLTAESGYYKSGALARYVEIASDSYPKTGIALANKAVGFTRFFAYYPKSDDNDSSEPE